MTIELTTELRRVVLHDAIQADIAYSQGTLDTIRFVCQDLQPLSAYRASKVTITEFVNSMGKKDPNGSPFSQLVAEITNETGLSNKFVGQTLETFLEPFDFLDTDSVTGDLELGVLTQIHYKSLPSYLRLTPSQKHLINRLFQEDPKDLK